MRTFSGSREYTFVVPFFTCMTEHPPFVYTICIVCDVYRCLHFPTHMIIYSLSGCTTEHPPFVYTVCIVCAICRCVHFATHVSIHIRCPWCRMHQNTHRSCLLMNIVRDLHNNVYGSWKIMTTITDDLLPSFIIAVIPLCILKTSFVTCVWKCTRPYMSHIMHMKTVHFATHMLIHSMFPWMSCVTGILKCPVHEN